MVLAETFEQLKASMASQLADLPLERLNQLAIELSNLRREAGGELRRQVSAFALEVSQHVSVRHAEREAFIREAQTRDVVRGARAQRVGVQAFAGEVDALFLQKLQESKPA